MESVSVTVQQPTTFAQRLAAAREQAFVGRSVELQSFEDMLGCDSATRLWFVVGPGGIGKTALLQMFHARALAMEVPVAHVDARNVHSNPPAVRYALEQAAGNQPLSTFCANYASPVLLIDTFEEWRDLEWWWREDLLPATGAKLRVVIASRCVPQSSWTDDPGWQDLMNVTTLGDLDEHEAGNYLALRGVEGPSRQTLLEFSGGRPLILALGADMAAQGRGLQTQADVGPVIEHLVDRFTSEAECPGQRQALDAAAIVREIDESLLARMLNVSDAHELYEWLSQLSFMESRPGGVFPHEQVRETLMHDMVKRFPGRYETYVQRAFEWFVSRIEAAGTLSWIQAARHASDGIYALRALDVVQHFLYPSGARSLYIQRAEEKDKPILADMVAYHEGAESRSWFEFWWQRAPDAVFVVRDPAGAARGLFMRLDMESLAADDRDADPLTACLWRHITHEIQPEGNVHLPFIRFWLSAEHAQSQSAEKTAILMAINSYNLMATNLRLTAQVFHDSPEWEAQARALGITRLHGNDTRIGETTWRIYYNDWYRESPARYYRHFAERCIALEAAMDDVPMASGYSGTAMLDERGFHAAVADALKSYHLAVALRANPLLGSALVLARTGRGADEDSRVRLLREQITQTVELLARRPEPGPQDALLLRRTYLKSAECQKRIAADMGMGYSTYRRRLAEARKDLSAALWRAEIAQR